MALLPHLNTWPLQRTVGYHYGNDLDKQLDGTISKPRVASFDWAALADEKPFEFIELKESEDAEEPVPV
ncbi:MAG: hypothetical protein ACYS19_00745 [Planctomycetota bacterium]|jgi:hypothetical protein